MLPGDQADIPDDDERWNLEAATIWDRQVAPDFDQPDPPRTEQFILEPLGEQHDAAGYAA